MTDENKAEFKNQDILRIKFHRKPNYSLEITKLRKAGKLDDALYLATKSLAEEPDNIWNKRAASWVHYDFLKKNVAVIDFEKFHEHLLKLKELELPEDENMLFDQCAWKIGSMVYGLQKESPVDYTKINTLYAIAKTFHFTKPSEAYSFIFKAFLKGHAQWSNYLEFADWWGLENLLPEDYQAEEYEGTQLLATAEQAYIAYAKKLLEGEAMDGFGIVHEVDKEKIQTFLPELDVLIENHPEYQYPSYFKAKMLIALGGSTEDVLKTYRPFAKKKQNVFWVWELMAEIFSDNEIKFACYCKALSLKTPEDYIVKLRLNFASILISQKMYGEAKTEIEKVVAVRKANGWRLTNQITQWIEQEWYQSAEVKSDNSDLYATHLQKAENILFSDLPEITVAVEFVNRNKNIINFVRDRDTKGFFKYDRKVLNPDIGDLLSVRLGKVKDKKYLKVFTASPAPEGAVCEAIKDFSGNIKIIPPNNFGFVDNVFIHPKMIDTNNLSEDQMVFGKAILSFNKSKDEWGWKAVEISEMKNKKEK